MVWAPDSPDLWAPDSATPNRWAPDSGGHLTLGRAVDLFLAAKAAEGAAAKTLEWYGMILRRAVCGLGEERPIEQLAGPELRAWILELRSTLSPISVAGYVRTLKVFGNRLAAEELAQAAALRTLRKPRVPDKLVEPISDDAMRRLLAVADVRDRAILLLLLDCGLRVSEAAGLRLGDLRPDGTLKVLGKGAKERIVPVGGTARTAIVRYMGQRGAGAPDEPLFLGRRGDNPMSARRVGTSRLTTSRQRFGNSPREGSRSRSTRRRRRSISSPRSVRPGARGSRTPTATCSASARDRSPAGLTQADVDATRNGSTTAIT
jgi:site-specific recombinase XerD